ANMSALRVTDTSEISEIEFTRALATASQALKKGEPVKINEPIRRKLIEMCTELGPYGWHYNRAYQKKRMAIRTSEYLESQALYR
ncbi:hypothetical protein, partial [Streptomyces sp. IBSBF 2390]|uniref:hypothetical protein n=1 Tax=Streptomyces sp. IBSBF 2390 TaxID=2903533 RepID=UPI002FDBB130